MDNPRISRRTVLRSGTLAAAALAVGGSAVGCSTDETVEANRGEANVKARLPSYHPVELIKPDLPGNEVLMPGYYAYPRNPEPAFQNPPGAGLDQVTIMYPTFIATPPRPDRNSFYAQVQEELGDE
ncbi:MAG TPA: hypothetical protein VK020_03930, partial [Microlunatus sp.]|nr:hypothetical protein [Microlunatus sp.]